MLSVGNHKIMLFLYANIDHIAIKWFLIDNLIDFYYLFNLKQPT